MRQTKAAREPTSVMPMNMRNSQPIVDWAKEWTEGTGPPRLMNMPICARVKATMMITMFHIRNMPWRRWTMIECMKAVIASQGISAEFSTGSQAQYPPHPRIVYAHHEPRSSPSVRISHETMPHIRPRSTHSSRPPRPASIAPTAMLKGIATATSPVIWTGGWMNMPKWTSSGLIPAPSAGVTGRRSSGLARNRITPRKKVSTSAITPMAIGVVCGRLRRMVSAATAARMEKTSAMNRSEPALPAYIATHV